MIRRRIRTAAAARRDIDHVAQWIAAQSGVNAAMKWLAALDEALDVLARVPGSGTSRSYLRPGLRSSPFFRHVIFFKSTKTVFTVVRVIHGARDYERVFRQR
jgi:toxin ParE1/3/4